MVAIVVYSLSQVQIFCKPMDCSPPGFSVHGISQARILELVVISSPGDSLQCSCLENPRDRGTWWAAVYGVAQSPTRLK